MTYKEELWRLVADMLCEQGWGVPFDNDPEFYLEDLSADARTRLQALKKEYHQ